MPDTTRTSSPASFLSRERKAALLFASRVAEVATQISSETLKEAAMSAKFLHTATARSMDSSRMKPCSNSPSPRRIISFCRERMV